MGTTLALIATATSPMRRSPVLTQEPGPPLASGGESPMTQPATAVLLFVGLVYLILVW